MPLNVTLPDGTVQQVESGSTPAAIAASLGKRLVKDAVAATVDGRLVDLSTPLAADCTVEIVTGTSPEGLDVLRHSAAHVMAEAVLELYPEAKLTIGPAVENGFYYDIDMQPVSDEDFPKIEAEMKKAIKAKSVGFALQPEGVFGKEGDVDDVDAFVYTAEAGSAWISVFFSRRSASSTASRSRSRKSRTSKASGKTKKSP